jgi:hypothetical protein
VSAFDDFPELAGADRQAERAATLLERAAQAITGLAPNETWSERATRLRGAAAMAQTAVLQIAVTAGWNEAGDAASRAGLLDSAELPTDPHASEDPER